MKKKLPKYREKIIQTASRLIIKQGVSNTSLANIANAVGISKGTLFYYYPTKSDLIFDISERHMRHITGKIFTWIEASGKLHTPEAILRQVFKMFIASSTRGQIHIYLIQEALLGNERLKKRYCEIYQQWVQQMKEGMVRVLGPGYDYSLLAYLIVAAMDGILLQHLLHVPNIPLQDLASFLTRIEKVVTNEPAAVRSG